MKPSVAIRNTRHYLSRDLVFKLNGCVGSRFSSPVGNDTFNSPVRGTLRASPENRLKNCQD
jgi:hypothetical protein